jgi:hypothetical protein
MKYKDLHNGDFFVMDIAPETLLVKADGGYLIIDPSVFIPNCIVNVDIEVTRRTVEGYSGLGMLITKGVIQ